MTGYHADGADYEAVVFDLDGTLVDLDVDWAVVERDVGTVLGDRGLAVDGHDLWGMLELSDEAGHRDAVEATIGEHERRGARRSDRLPAADDLPLSVPVGVCSLNCEAACRIALDAHDLSRHVDALVGRDSVATEKPHPEPLLTTVTALDARPERTLFVGDSERDELTARRAGTGFRYV
ncbi:HAD family hydrolase [Halomarina halobia]|uniref:HAD family hydrolase n=1 Tax=Halomarina halobia TaxID=3033386 RepID=A0ABD6A431_9EURY|nr:HAD family hydrolase [Halomarina sp. PSR21]